LNGNALLQCRSLCTAAFHREIQQVSFDESDSDSSEEDIMIWHSSESLFLCLVNANPTSSEVSDILTVQSPISTPLDFATLLCKLIIVAPQIDLYLAMLYSLTTLDEVDLSVDLNAQMVDSLIAHFFRLPTETAKHHCLALLHRTANICDHPTIYDEVMRFVMIVLARETAGSGPVRVAVLFMIELIPINQDDVVATAIQALFWRHSPIQTRVLMAMTQFVLKQTGIPVLNNDICDALFAVMRRILHDRYLIEFFECVMDQTSPDAELLISR
jgi:hypothetical protein